MAYLAIGARALLTVVFLVSASSKLRSGAAYADFAASVRAFRLLPERAVGPVAALVTAVECCVPVLVWVPATAVAGTLLAVVLLAFLTLAVWLVVRRGSRPVCRCFGPSGQPIGVIHVARNLVLLAVAAVSLAGGAVSAAGGLVAVSAGVVGALTVVKLDGIGFLFTRPGPTNPAS